LSELPRQDFLRFYNPQDLFVNLTSAAAVEMSRDLLSFQSAVTQIGIIYLAKEEVTAFPPQASSIHRAKLPENSLAKLKLLSRAATIICIILAHRESRDT